MDAIESKNYASFYLSNWDKAIQERHYEEALSAAIKGYLIAKDVDDGPHKLGFLGILRLSIHNLIDPAESDQIVRCSFCGKTENSVKKVIASANAFICNECVDLCNQILEEQEKIPTK